MKSAAVSHSAMTSTYAVPKRFGMAGILAITTFMAVLFGILRSFDCHPIVYVVLGVLALVTCLVQMRYGDVPRIASIVAGAIVLPLTAMVAALLIPALDRGGPGGFELFVTLLFATPFLAAAGAFFGYLAGAMTAGVFLLMDLVEPHLPGGTGVAHYAEQIARQRQQEEIVVATIVSDDKPPLPPKLGMPASSPPPDDYNWTV